jgi:hypothetical protein
MKTVERSGTAKVIANRISPGHFPGEHFVQLISMDGLICGFFPSASVDVKSRKITVTILDREDNKYLVNLPAPTLSTGSRAWFSEELIAEGV